VRFGDDITEPLRRGTQATATLDPSIVAASIAAVTTKLGLAITKSATYFHPYELARIFASLDHFTGGRVAWNIVTSYQESAARNLGLAEQMEHDARYDRADEFMEAVQGLWDSWEEGAITTNVETGEYFDKTKVHSLDHVGKFYSVRGPLNLTRTWQGHPVLVQAGASEDGQKFAARFAEMVFAVHLDKEHAKQHYASFKAMVAACGRNPEHCKIVRAAEVLVGRDEEDAARGRGATGHSGTQNGAGSVPRTRHATACPSRRRAAHSDPARRKETSRRSQSVTGGGHSKPYFSNFR